MGFDKGFEEAASRLRSLMLRPCEPICDNCGGQSRLIEVSDQPIFGLGDVRLHRFECPACGETIEETL